MAETSASQFHRGQANKGTVPMGPGGANKEVGLAIFSENPSDGDVAVWGRWAHELGHAFQQGGRELSKGDSARRKLIDDRITSLTQLAQVGAHLLEAMLEGESIDALPLKSIGELAKKT